MSELTFNHYMRIELEHLEQTFSKEMESAGYFAFYTFVEDFRNGLKIYSDEEIPLYGNKLARAKELFPRPERFSPSWCEIWDEFSLIYQAKNEALTTIPVQQRDGEWQIIIDNPYSHNPVVCYTALPFLEASYLYGYFQRELKPHEVLRLQRIGEMLQTNGRKEASILPDY
ncbi:hypothetical protein D7Z26_02530 [Cohnella endophytica]|uniref:Uncharacterized protein n=1 Tax=Cohnella endophytica TaxID=2419778 RepID=A0A494Y2B3_9BACL|nr:hypothetical protein [Cohnella endophytica]RKP56884.1 hypothetical protein D7Z26_02530 [Cohnella endophytica]